MDTTKLRANIVEELQSNLADLQTAANDAEEACYGVLDAKGTEERNNARDVLIEALDEIDRNHLQLRSFLARKLGDNAE